MHISLQQEFDCQVQVLIAKGYPQAAHMTEEAFIALLAPLREHLPAELPAKDFDTGILPFVIVITDALIPAETTMALTEKNGKAGVTILRPHTSADFQTVADVVLPNTSAYLLIDIDRGKQNINIPPNEALPLLQKEGRSPPTIAEGIVIVTQFPEFLIKNNCFSLLASRTGSDQRVPAIWINAKKEPNLGWCWDGNPHTWLGSASCKSRIGRA